MKLFLDDYRSPIDCFPYMWQRIGNLTPMYNDGKWRIVRNYPEFISAINKFKGEITHISFDHDLVDEHYNQNVQEGVIDYESKDFANDDFNKTGFHAAQYLKSVYEREKLDLPVIFVHSMNPVGTENILTLFNTHSNRSWF